MPVRSGAIEIVVCEAYRRVGFELSFRRALWSIIVRELVAGDVDLVCSAATVTKEREREVDFCSPYLRLALVVVKRDGSVAQTPRSRVGSECGAEPQRRPMPNMMGFLSLGRYLSPTRNSMLRWLLTNWTP